MLEKHFDLQSIVNFTWRKFITVESLNRGRAIT